MPGRKRKPTPKCEHCGRPANPRVTMRYAPDPRFVLEVCDPPYGKKFRTSYRSCAARLQAQGWEQVETA